ncbi:M10 family metallopeptidase C-terminal domain-containing protein [Pseudomonas sp. Marseille-Q5115]|uniref:M10 family metallopeptidase C-terminal domain-containing protein n=1 Tax=Pseudomonas sp. Marseille-Q5115 TaxID=2866593 RepID=UPI001CE3DC20|nr:M10 family metallopeptidase C-terminal domain-containing protein [Pseudomonas sp. Marseille-Q5115]
MSDAERAATTVDLTKPSKAYQRLDDYSHLYERGVTDWVNDIYPSYTVDQAAAEITRYGYSIADTNDNGTVALTYSFTREQPDNYDTSLGDFSAFSERQEAQARLAMRSWADVTNLTFKEAPSGGEAHLSLANYSASNGATAFAYYPTGDEHDGESWYHVSASDQDNAQAALNSYGRQVLVHELGHNLGLAHPIDYDIEFGFSGEYAEDSTGYTVMSYWSETGSGQNFKGAYASAPLMDDIASVQLLYGANLETRSGGTVYGFHSNSNREEMIATSAASKVVFSVWDGGGVDTLDFSGYHTNQRIDLHPTGFSDVGGLIGNVSIAQGVNIEKAFSGSGNDYLIGNGSGDKLWGGAGADTFVYFTEADSTQAAPDRLIDFVSGQDRIDLSGLPVDGSDTIHFASTLDGTAGAAVLREAGYGSSLAIDFDGDQAADFLLKILGDAQVGDMLV